MKTKKSDIKKDPTINPKTGAINRIKQDTERRKQIAIEKENIKALEKHIKEERRQMAMTEHAIKYYEGKIEDIQIKILNLKAQFL